MASPFVNVKGEGPPPDRELPYRVAIIDRTSMSGLTPTALQQLQVAGEAAQRLGLSLAVTAGRGPGHLSHGDGRNFDVRAYHDDGSLWTPEERVAVATAARNAGANRFGFYGYGGTRPTGNGTLHIGQGASAVTWGAGGQVRGPASRQFTNPAEIAFNQALVAGKPFDASAYVPNSAAAVPASLNAPAVGVSGHGAAPSPEVDTLARVMLAEARGEGQEGMIAVGQVAMNRIRDTSGRFPDTLNEVLTSGEFAPPLAVDPNSPEYQTAVAMAEGVINGTAPNPVGDAVYFMNPKTSTASGASKIRASGDRITTIGSHEFYGGGKFAPPQDAPVADDPAMIRQRLANRDAGMTFGAPPPSISSPTPIEYAAQSLPDETFIPRLDEGTSTTGAAAGANVSGSIPFTPPGMDFAGASRQMVSGGPTPSLGADLGLQPSPASRPPPIDLTNLLSTTTGSTPGAHANMTINPVDESGSWSPTSGMVSFQPPGLAAGTITNVFDQHDSGTEPGTGFANRAAEPGMNPIAMIAAGMPSSLSRAGSMAGVGAVPAATAQDWSNDTAYQLSRLTSALPPLGNFTASPQASSPIIEEDRATRVPFQPPPTSISPVISTLTAPVDPTGPAFQEDRATRAGFMPAVTSPPPTVLPEATPKPTLISAPAAPPITQPAVKPNWLGGIADKAKQYVDALVGGGQGIGGAWTPTVQGTSPSGTGYTAGPGARGGWVTQWTASDGTTITAREDPNTGQLMTSYG